MACLPKIRWRFVGSLSVIVLSVSWVSFLEHNLFPARTPANMPQLTPLRSNPDGERSMAGALICQQNRISERCIDRIESPELLDSVAKLRCVKHLGLTEREQNEDVAVKIAHMKSGGLVSGFRRVATVKLAMAAVCMGIPGDFVETGVNTGGTAVLMLQVLKSFSNSSERRFWGADSFQGLPSIDAKDRSSNYTAQGMGKQVVGQPGQFMVSKSNFLRNLKANQVLDSGFLQLLVGWFNETLPKAPIKQISFLRLDGDLYTSTLQGLEYLYPKLQVGGFVYVDDYGSFIGCRNAVEEYRSEHKITTKMVHVVEEGRRGIFFEAVWWQKMEDDWMP